MVAVGHSTDARSEHVSIPVRAHVFFVDATMREP
jgi:hypothetical protein